ncbi:MAG: TIGR01777 family protein [Acidobacteria bacterium]|nr:TIGR01777 family protein [Acidobacteriota bacterium]
MTIVVAGGSGFLGAALVSQLLLDGHTVVVLGRGASRMDPESGHPPAGDRSPARLAWLPDGTIGSWASAVDGADAVINLAGESIGGHRWTAAQKARVLDSRLGATRSLVAAVLAAARPPRLFVSASAVGYYGSRGDDLLTEESAPGTDFLAGVCAAWEREAIQAAAVVRRVVVLRSGLVLAADGGALAQMLTPFKLYAGGPLGSGRQFVAWIHREDWLRLVRWVLATDGVSGPVNATAPNPVTNAAFARALGRVLHRPSGIPAPAVALRLALGEMADALLLSSQRVLPAKATALGFTFRFPDLDEALGEILVK